MGSHPPSSVPAETLPTRSSSAPPDTKPPIATQTRSHAKRKRGKPTENQAAKLPLRRLRTRGQTSSVEVPEIPPSDQISDRLSTVSLSDSDL